MQLDQNGTMLNLIKIHTYVNRTVEIFVVFHTSFFLEIPFIFLQISSKSHYKTVWIRNIISRQWIVFVQIQTCCENEENEKKKKKRRKLRNAVSCQCQKMLKSFIILKTFCWPHQSAIHPHILLQLTYQTGEKTLFITKQKFLLFLYWYHSEMSFRVFLFCFSFFFSNNMKWC